MKMMIWMGASCIAMALSARATLTHTNGNFDAGVAAGDNNNVPDWFDGNHHPGAAWEDTWLNTVNIPSGQSGGTVGFSGNVPTATNFLYQSLGTRSADETMLCFSISVGAFTDGAVGTKTGTLHVGLYEQTGSFTGADGTDIAGASGIVQVGSTVALPISRVGGPGAVASDETGSFDISGVSTSHTLYLRYQWIPTGGSYMSVDNASISTVDTRPFTLATQRVVRAAEFADGQTCITVGLAGVPNRIYQIQYSTDMSPGSWSILAPYSTGATGLFEATFTKPGDVAADWNGRLFFRALDAMSAGSILKSDALRTYVASFNSQRPDDTSEGLAGDGSVTAIRNNQAAEWMEKNVPLFECSDKDIEEIYHFRWWTYRKHIRNTPDGFVVTEFLPQVSWSKKHNTINCPVGHHLYEGRWLRDPKIIDDYTRFYFGKGGDPGGTTKSYSNWITDGIYARYLVNADEPFITGLLDALVKDHEAWKQDGAAAGDNSNVPDWFDGNNHPGGNWEDTWLNTIHQPSGQSGGTVGFSGNVPTATNFLYQPIGTRNPGDGTLYFSISVGAFTDGWGLRSGTLHVGLYEQTGSFTGSDGTDIDGSDGVTQVGSTVALSISRVGGWVASDETGSFDISGVSTSNTLYLRYQWIPTDGSYISVDNASVSTVAPPSLKLTNGNFDAGAAAGDNSNVPDWFDGNHHPNGPWEDTWLNTINIPSGQSGGTVGFSGNIPTATNFLYQSIGTRNPGDSTLHFSISVGAFTDGEGIRSGTLHVGLYEQTGSFTGADGTDIAGASGIVQVGSTVALPISRVGGPGAVASDETGSFDISGVSTSHTLYLRYQWIPTGGSYMSVDNASISTVDTRPFTLATQRVVRAAEFADGQTCITVGLAGVPNRIYQIQYSTDMSPGSWSILAPYSTGATGLFEATFTKPGDVAADWNGRLFFRALDAMSAGSILKSDALRTYVASFNSQRPDDTSEGLAGDGSVTAIRNNQAAEWMEKNVPLFECSDKDIEEIYHFRWWTYRKHIRNTPDGFVVTEFLPQVSWSKKHNTINCPVGHHLYEGRWLRDPKIIDDYTRFYFGKGGDPGGTTKSYSNWITDGIYARYLVNADEPFITGLLDALVKDHEAWKQDGAAAGDNSNVPDWFDGNNHPGGNWEDTWLNTIHQPSGQSGGTVGFSGNVPTATNFLYQPIGTRNPGDGTLYFSISVGAFTDGWGLRSGTLHVGLYEQTGSFTGSDGTDIDGSDGVTQVGSTVALSISRVGGWVASDETGSFDISGVSTSNTLYLRYQWIPTDGSYMSVDNASITVSQGVTYATWASNNGVAGNPDEDSDNDGVSNGMEYFMGIASSDPVFTVSPGVGLANNISWPMSATFAGTYEVETSPDLRTWTPVNPKPTPVGGYLTYTVQSGAEGGKSFVRLAVTPD